MTPRWALFGGISLLAVLVGIAIAVASSLASISPDRHGETNSFVQPSPSLLPTPSPTVKAPGVLDGSARLVTNGSNTVIALGSNSAIGSADGGRTWIVVRPPANGSGLAVDTANPRHAITGGSAIQVTNDGVTWTQTLAPPPGKGPYQPLAISPIEPNVWLFTHQDRLLVTRDGSATWTESSVPQLTNAFVVPGQALGQFFLASGSRVFQLTNYGQTVTEKPALSQGNVAQMVLVGGTRSTLFASVAGRGVFQLAANGWVSAGSPLSGPIASGGDETILVGNGGGKLASAGLIAYSTNGGATWLAARGLPTDQTVDAISGQAGSSTFYAYCYGGDLYVSSDGGLNWTLLSRALRAG